MNLIILTGGFGTRLGEETEVSAKSLAEIAARTRQAQAIRQTVSV